MRKSETDRLNRGVHLDQLDQRRVITARGRSLRGWQDQLKLGRPQRFQLLNKSFGIILGVAHGLILEVALLKLNAWPP